MALPDVFCEDPRYLERDAPPLREEFPPGTKVFFLGKIPYGAAAQITAAEDTTLSIVIAVRLNSLRLCLVTLMFFQVHSFGGSRHREI